MRVRVQQEQKFLVATERALLRYDNAFIFTNQSEVDFGITLVLVPSSRVQTGLLTLEDGIDRLCQNVGMELPLYAAYIPEERRCQHFYRY